MNDRLPLPIGGAADLSPHAELPPVFVPRPAIANMRPFDKRGRRRPAQRASIRKLFATQLGGGDAGRALQVIHRPAGVSGFTAANCETFAGASSVAGTISGNHWLLDPEIAMFAALHVDSSAGGGTAFEAVQHGAWSPDGATYAVLSNYTDTVSGFLECQVELRSLATGAAVWSYTIADATGHRYGDTLCVTHEYVIVATNNKLLVLLAADGSLVDEFDVPWCYHAVKVFRNAAATIVGLAFDGSTAAGVTVGGVTIESGIAAMQFRAGVMLFHVGSYAAVGVGGLALSQLTFGAQLDNADPWSEGSVHGYWRISEHARYKPRGANVTDACFAPDGSIILLTTNQGIGPNSTYPPDGSQGYATVRKITAAGVLAWELDTASIREAFTYNATTYYCDIHEGTTEDPSVQAVDVDAEGYIYVGGRQNAAGQSAFCISPGGVPVWATNVVNAGATASVRQAGVAVDPGDNNPVFVFDRNTSWEGAAGREAILLKLDRGTGGYIKHYDLGAAVSGLSVSFNPARTMLLCTDKVN